MKFEVKDASKELVAKLTAKGEKLNLSERSINEQLEKLIPLVSNDEMELDDFIAKVLPFIQTANANVRKDVADGIKEYQDANPYKDKGDKDKKDNNNGDDELKERIKKLEEQLENEQKARKISQIKKDLMSKIKEKGVNDSGWVHDLIGEISISEDFNVEEKAEAYVKLYNKKKVDDIDPVDPPKDPKPSEKQAEYTKKNIEAAKAYAKQMNLIS